MINQNNIICPLIDAPIEIIDCVENVDSINGLINLDSMPPKYKAKEDYIDICKKCKYHNM